MGYKTQGEWQTFRAKVRNEGLEAKNSGKMSQDSFDRREQIIDTMENTILGRPVQEYKTHLGYLNLLKKYNYITTGASFGRASLVEISETFARVGFKSTMKQVPSFREVFK